MNTFHSLLAKAEAITGKKIYCSFAVANLGKIGGHAYYNVATGEMKITVNKQLTQEQISDIVLPHEMAHIMCYAMGWLDENHGRRWVKYCRLLGGDGSRLHSFKLRSKCKEFEYSLPSGKKAVITSVRHNRVQDKGIVYRTASGERITKTTPFREI